MATISELVVKITGDSSGLESSLNKATTSVDNFAGQASKLGAALGAAGLAMALDKVVDIAAEMVDAFSEAEQSQLKFNAAVGASNTITAEGKARLESLAESFAALAGEDDDAVLGMEAMLAATGRTTEEIEKMLPAALGLANATGTDLDAALTQLNQTFSGTAGRLGRTTPELNALTKEELENGAAIDVMLGKYGDLSTALEGSAKTSMANFNTQVGNLKESFGETINSGLQPFRDGMTEVIKVIVNNKPLMVGALTAISVAIVGIGTAVTVSVLPALAALAATFSPAAPIMVGIAAVAVAIGGVVAAVENLKDKNDKATKDLLQTSGSVQDSAQRRASAEKEVGAAAAAAAKTASDAWAEAEKKIIEGRKDATKAYTDSLAEIDTRVQLGLMTEQEAAEAKYKANRELMDRLISLGYTGAKTSKQIGDQTLREALARNESLYNDTTEGMEKIGKLYAQLAETRSSQEKKGQDEAVLTTQVLAAEDAARVETAAASATDRTAYEQEYADAVAGMAKDLKKQAILNAAALAAEEAALTMSVKKEVTNRTALEYEAYTTVVGYMSNMVDGYSAAAAAKTAAEEAHTVAVQAEVTSQDALISEQVAAVVGYSEKITDAYAVAAEKKTGFEEGFTQAVATETASQTALQDEAVQTQIGYAKELSGANYDAAKESKAAWLAAADDIRQGQEAAITPLQRAWGDFSSSMIAKAQDWGKELKKVADVGIKGVGDAFEGLGDALASGGDGWAAFEQAAEQSLKRILSMLGDQLAVQAIAAALMGNWAGAGIAAGGAIAAWLAAGASSQFAEFMSWVRGGGSGSSSSSTGPAEIDIEPPEYTGGSPDYTPPPPGDRDFVSGRDIDRFASGGVSRGGMAVVGEEGPELVQLPRGAHVFTNEESQQIASGGRNLTVNFYSPAAMDPIEMRREFERLDRQLAFEGAF